MVQDQELKEAAKIGDEGSLRKAVAEKPPHYFLTQLGYRFNIFHIASNYNQVKFVRTAMEILPPWVNSQLLSQENYLGQTPLHSAAYGSSSSTEMVKVMLGFYKSSHSGPPIAHHNTPWWSAVDEDNRTVLHSALYGKKDESAMEILSMGDIELMCNMIDSRGNSPLFLAIRGGYNLVAEKILTSTCSYSLSGEYGSTALHFAHKTSENILRLLLVKHPDLIETVDNDGNNVLHIWAENNGNGLLNNFFLIGNFPAAAIKTFMEISSMRNKMGDTALHIAASLGNIDFIKALIYFYRQEIKTSDSIDDTPPWKIKNTLDGNTPLHVVLLIRQKEFDDSRKHYRLDDSTKEFASRYILADSTKEVASYFISVDSTLCSILNNKGESSLFVAVELGYDKQVEEILKTVEVFTSRMLRRNDGTTVLHVLPNMSEEMGKKLLEKFWWINLPNDKKRKPLDEAKERNIPWLVDLLSEPSLINRERFNWIKACAIDDTEAVFAFIENCQDLQIVCRQEKDTPLHHIKSLSYNEYLNLLKNSSIAELKNAIDSEGRTPLHRALDREDKFLAKALLNDSDVKRIIADKNGKTAMSILAELCRENKEWEMMCDSIGVNPYMKTTYVQPGTNLDQMRNTLSVVAALLATITFAAGFTLPGGVDDKSGNAILAKKAAFLVFLLADAYAMCASMLVLFCLIWSMVSTKDMSELLVDRSVLILMQSLYGTMVAFMTGIYTMISHDSLWAVIIVFVMCGFIGISVNRTVLYTVLSKLLPRANQDQNEEEKDFTSKNDDSRTIKRTSSKLLQNSTSLAGKKNGDDQIRLLEEGKLGNASASRNDDGNA